MQDFFKQQAEWLSTWQEQQQKLAKQYADWGEELGQGATAQALPTNFEDLLKAQQDLFTQFTSFGANLQQNIQQTWGDKMPTELLHQFKFNVLEEFYKSWLGNMKFPGGMQNPFMFGQNWTDPSSFLNNFMAHENPFFSAFSNNTLTDGLKKMFGMFDMLQGSKLPGGDLYGQMFTNFQSTFNQLSNTTSSQGFEKLLETFASWKEQSDKYLLAPQVGIDREAAQDVSKVISLSTSYVQALAKMSKLIEQTARKSGNRFQAKLVERSLNNEPPIKFSDFCSLWTKENEVVFLEVFGTEEFAKTQGEFTGAGMRLKMQMDKLIERVLVQTPIALKSDIDLAAKEIQQLKRELRQSRKQQQELTAEVKRAQESSAAADKRLQDLETALTKIQSQPKIAEKPANATTAKKSQPARKSPVVKPVKTKATAPPNATSPRSPKVSGSTKKTADPATKK